MEGQQRELFELAPPMDPLVSRAAGTTGGSNQSPGSAISGRLRPVNLPGLSAGLSAISANYGVGLFEEDNSHHQLQQQQSGPSSSSHGHNSTSSNGPAASLAPLMAAAAFRRPGNGAAAHYHFPQSCPPVIYSPYGGGSTQSQPSDPCTPTMGIGCLSSSSNSAQSTYLSGAFSPVAGNGNGNIATGFDQLSGVGPFLWPWAPFFGANGSDIIGYTSAADQLLLNPHSAYNLLSSPVELYAPQSSQGSSSSSHQPLGPIPHLDHFFGHPPASGHQKSASGKSLAQPKAQAAASVGAVTACKPQMPRGQPRKGGRRPRETEQAEHLTDDDKDRRAKRRERNKQAAARCRRRREERMATLETQVAELQAQNEAKEHRIAQLAAERDRYIEALQQRNCPLKPGELGQMMPRLNGNNGRAAAGGIGILAPPAMNTRKRAQQQVPPYKLERPSMTTESTPPRTPPPSGHGQYANCGPSSVLVNGTDPVISESSLVQPQHLFESKHPKFEPPSENGQSRPPSNNNRPNSLHLDGHSLLYKEGYVANTPSKELASYGSGCFGGIGLLGTPGNELITPSLSHLTDPHAFGVLMAQQTGLTPCQNGPVPVLMQPQEEQCPPSSGQLSELR